MMKKRKACLHLEVFNKAELIEPLVLKKMLSDKKANGDDENVIVVRSDYVLSNRGVVLTFYLTTEFEEITSIVEIANMFVEFVNEEYLELLEEFSFEARYKTPIVYSADGSELTLALCFTADDSVRLQQSFKKHEIEQVNYL